MPAKAKHLKWEPYPAKRWVPHNISGTLGHDPFFAKCAEKSQLLQKKKDHLLPFWGGGTGGLEEK